MAQPDAKKLFEKFRTHWQCFACKVPPGPKERKDRYLCMKNNHPLCADCKNSCPCQSRAYLSSKPCEALAKMITEFPWFHCCFYENGCRELIKETDYEDHRKICIYRKVNCVSLSCKEKVNFQYVSEHIVQHKIDPAPMVSRNKFTASWNLTNDLGVNRRLIFKPQQLLTSFEELFFATGYAESCIFYFWIYMVASPCNVKNYECTLSFSNQENEVSFRGQVLTLDDKFEEISRLENCLTCNMLTVERYLDVRTKELTLHVKLRNLKEEAKNEDIESGVSDSESDQEPPSSKTLSEKT